MELMLSCKKCKNYTELDSEAETREELANLIGNNTFTITCGSCSEEAETHVNFVHAEKGDLEKFGPLIASIIVTMILGTLFSKGFNLLLLFFSLSTYLLFQTYVNKKLSDFNSKRVK